MFGTSASLENERTHKVIAIDEVLQRHENRTSWIFPDFAEDIFMRRMKSAGYERPEKANSLLSYVFGSSLTPEHEVQAYVKSKTSPDKIIKLEKDWPQSWNDYLREIAKSDLLSATLGSAWARQKGKSKIVHDEKFPNVPPWSEKVWWKKERYPLALMQIASRNQQQLQWSGKEEILSLSGGNILAFLSLCQHIWDVWLRFMRDVPMVSPELPQIERSVQTIGIQESSHEWFEKIAEAEHGDYRRQRFIRYLLACEEDIIVWIEEFVQKGSRLVIDISSLPKLFFFPAIRLLLKQESIQDLLVTYTIPMTYHHGSIAERPSEWRALPLFGPETHPEPKYEVAAIGVGFLPFGLPDLLKSDFLGAKPHLFFPFPASPSTYFKTWEFVRQIEASLPLSSDDQLVRINGLDPSDAFDHICWLTEQNTKKALFAPYGPKPMSLGMAIYATLTGSPVFYTQPRVYHSDYSIGVRCKDGRPEVYAYCLKLGGRNLFQI